MTALVDTSVLVRYLTGDRPALDRAVRDIIDGPASLAVTDLILLETAYVLASQYGRAREAIVDALVEVVMHDNIEVVGIPTDIVLEALALCRPSGRVSIADALVWATARAFGWDTVVYSLDRRFPSDGIEVVHPA